MNTFGWRLSGPISLAFFFFIISTDLKQEFSIWASCSHNPRFLLLMDLILLNHFVLRKCILFLQHLISKVHFRSFERRSAKWFSANDSRDALQGHVASPGAATISLLVWIDSVFLISCLYVFFFQILQIYRLVTLHPHFHLRDVIIIFTQFLRMSVITVLHDPLHTHPSYCRSEQSFPGIRIPREKVIPRKSHIFVQTIQNRWG